MSTLCVCSASFGFHVMLLLLLLYVITCHVTIKDFVIVTRVQTTVRYPIVMLSVIYLFNLQWNMLLLPVAIGLLLMNHLLYYYYYYYYTLRNSHRKKS